MTDSERKAMAEIAARRIVAKILAMPSDANGSLTVHFKRGEIGKLSWAFNDEDEDLLKPTGTDR